VHCGLKFHSLDYELLCCTLKSSCLHMVHTPVLVARNAQQFAPDYSRHEEVMTGVERR